MAYDEFTAKMVRKCSELEKALVEKDAAYQQLMEKAVRFANYIKDEFTYDDDPRFIEADEFLESPKAQAWKELKK